MSVEPAVQSPLPSRHAVRSLIEGLVGRDVTLVDGDPMSGKATNVLAVYVTDQLAVSAVVVVNVEAAARLGGALGMLPKPGVDDAVAAGQLTELMRDNCYEVLNVLAAVFNVEGAPHVRLYQMYGPDGTVPPDVLALSNTVGSRMDINLTIAGYGEGQMAVVTR